jgi:midasin
VHYDDVVNAPSTFQLLSALSLALANPCLTTTVAKLFRPLLIDLCSRWIGDSKNSERHLVALSYLVEVHEELFPYVSCRISMGQPSDDVSSILHRILLEHFDEGPLAFLSSVTSLESVNIVRFHQLLLAYYRILQINRELPRYLLWSLAPLSRLIESDLDRGVHFLAIRCYSLQSGMAEAERIKLERRKIGEPFEDDLTIIFGQNLDGTNKDVDGWMLPVIELRRIQEEREEMVTRVDNFYSQDETNEVARIQDSDLRFYK